jgi:uncharacterized protein DUF4129
MMRTWTEAFANLSDVIPVPLLAFLSLVATALVALGWYFWPAWLPWHWWLGRSASSRSRSRSRRERGRGRLGLPRWRWRWRWRRRRRRAPTPAAADLPADQLPDLPAQVLAMTADEFAAAGRYAEAVRERLRAIVRTLIERDLIPNSPGWTVTELAAAAGRARPALSPALRAATGVFSEIWYGLRPAHDSDDAAMRRCAGEISQLLDQPGAAAAEPVAAGAP